MFCTCSSLACLWMKTNVGMDLIPYLRAVFYKRYRTKRQKQTTVEPLVKDTPYKGHNIIHLHSKYTFCSPKCLFLHTYNTFVKWTTFLKRTKNLIPMLSQCVLYLEVPYVWEETKECLIKENGRLAALKDNFI